MIGYLELLPLICSYSRSLWPTISPLCCVTRETDSTSLALIWYPLSKLSPSSSSHSQPLLANILCSDSVIYFFIASTYEGEHAVFFCIWLVSPNTKSPGSIHFAASDRLAFSSMAAQYSVVCVSHFLYPSFPMMDTLDTWIQVCNTHNRAGIPWKH